MQVLERTQVLETARSPHELPYIDIGGTGIHTHDRDPVAVGNDVLFRGPQHVV